MMIPTNLENGQAFQQFELKFGSLTHGGKKNRVLDHGLLILIGFVGSVFSYFLFVVILSFFDVVISLEIGNQKCILCARIWCDFLELIIFCCIQFKDKHLEVLNSWPQSKR